MGGYWFQDPDNPFNRMDYTRGGGGLNNSLTAESNERRAEAMPSGSLGAIPRYADTMTAAAQMDGPGLAFIDGQLGYVSTEVQGPGTGQQSTGGDEGGGQPTTGPGSGGASNTPTPEAVPGVGAKPKPSFGVGAGSIGYTLGPVTGPGSKVKMPQKADGQRKVPVPYGGDEVLILEPDERFPDVEDWWEPRYGEPGEWIGGGINMAIDADKNAANAVLSSIKIKPGSAADVVIRNAPTLADGLTPKAIPDSELPNPMNYAPMSGW